MVEKKADSATFEIIVVLAIVAIVAVTGQVLIYYDGQTGASSSIATADGLTGFVISEDKTPTSEIHDLSVEKVEVLPESPLIGDPFEVKVTLKNKGDSAISTPFIVDAYFKPMSDDDLPPVQSSAMIPQIIQPGEEVETTFTVATIMPEGPLRITVSADSTAKLQDDNSANNIFSKTIIVSVE